jgi:hypothetical protein
MRWRALLLLLMICPSTFGQESKSAPARVLLEDGGSIVCVVAVDALTVDTKYGPLKIPIADIRSIQFGVHFEAKEKELFDAASLGLASAVFKEREKSSADLLRFGRRAIPTLDDLAKSESPEVAGRAAAVHAKLLRAVEKAPPAFDRIITADGEIRGQIRAQSIKVKSPILGELHLPLSKLLSVSMRGSGTKSLDIDAARFGSSLETWMPTGMNPDRDDRLIFVADGSVDLWPQGPGQYLAAPKGYNTAGKGGQFMAGALIGKVGEHGKAFYIGDKADVKADAGGELYLQIVPSPWNNASAGSYKVALSIRGN